ncbi:LysR family transcriptional regulator [Pseudooceanicola sp. CBS1P-1]|uniref:LysR family transcriptional regulator n=1 Tax=Pseudooceanicola albus TaxID=2692189 RepID=A0A6L7G3T4_9RHOB|nr:MULTISPECIES: LysR substrate-binding domain-containing protein [Pseudooceanicola]MBT9385376.1 LysR family transcriptional regulator [Pseudooceanicola endophyticus]MXN18765.1 LysR family transcriptional regulator [Pseudooceanicola albus]
MKRGALPLNALRAFEATLRLGQMKLAAEELGVTYGAISRQVRGLEALLGVTLFEGPRNKLVPTPAAQSLQPALQSAFDGIEEALARLLGQERRLVDLSCLSTLSMRWLIPRLYDFQDAHPQIELRLSAADGPVDFRRDRHDLAIRVGPGPWAPAEAVALFEDRVGPVLAPGRCPAGADWAALSALPLLHTRTRAGAWADWCAGQGLPLPPGGRSFEHFYFLLEAATAGLGMAIAPEVLVRDDLQAGRLVAPFGFVPSGQSYVCLAPPGLRPEAALVRDWLVAQARTAQDLPRPGR